MTFSISNVVFKLPVENCALTHEVALSLLFPRPSTLKILAGAFNQTAQDQQQTVDVQSIVVVNT